MSDVSSSRRLRLPATLLAVAVSGACLYGPPLTEPPEIVDFPPIVGTVSPDPAVIRRLNRNEGETVTLFASDITDQNFDDLITFEFALLLSATANEEQPLPFVVAVGQLEPEADLDERGRTVYQPVSRLFDPCDQLIAAVLTLSGGNGIVRLRLEDEVPEEQRAELGTDRHRVDITWSFSFVGECLQ